MCRLYIRLRGCLFCLPSSEDVHYTRMGDLETVRRAKNVFNAMSEEGHVKIYKQRMIGCDRQTLEKVFKTIERDWGVQINDFPEFKDLIAETRASRWMEDSDQVEVIERSNYGAQILFVNVQQSIYSGKYNLVICHLEAHTKISNDVLIGGMITEGILARDVERDRLYLQ